MKKTNIMIFRASEQIMKGIDNLVKIGVYRSKTEVINEALRNFLGLTQNNSINSKLRRR